MEGTLERISFIRNDLVCPASSSTSPLPCCSSSSSRSQGCTGESHAWLSQCRSSRRPATSSSSPSHAAPVWVDEPWMTLTEIATHEINRSYGAISSPPSSLFSPWVHRKSLRIKWSLLTSSRTLAVRSRYSFNSRSSNSISSARHVSFSL